MRTYENIRRDADRDIDARDASKFTGYIDELAALGSPEADAFAERLHGLRTLHDGDPITALQHFHTAASLFETLGSTSDHARVVNNMASAYSAIHQPSRALETYMDALSRFETAGDLDGVAGALMNIGVLQGTIGMPNEALVSLQRALVIFVEIGSTAGAAHTLANLATLHVKLGRYADAMESALRSISFYEMIDDASSVTSVLNDLGVMYYHIADYPSALEYYHRVLRWREEHHDTVGIRATLTNIGNVYSAVGDAAQALQYYERVLGMLVDGADEHVRAIVSANIGIIHRKEGDYTAALSRFRTTLAMFEHLSDRAGVQKCLVNILEVLVRSGAHDEAVEVLRRVDAEAITYPGDLINREMSRALMQEQEGRLAEARSTLQAALDIAETHRMPEPQIEIHFRLRELSLLQQDLAGYVLHNAEYTRIKEETTGGVTTAKLAVQQKQREIEAERREVDKQLAVLHSALPQEVAQRVARGETVNDHYDEATVIFADIVGFTAISDRLSPGEVVVLLEKIFSAFDAVCERHNVTKIKTIGDSYMAVAFPSETPTQHHVIRAAQCALDMLHTTSRATSREVSHEVSRATSREAEFRIGMHCGPVTAGVIGTQRLQYDVWGDTVNVASRMESAGLPGRVHVTEAIVNAMANAIEYREYGIEERGEIDVKGKGMMRTFWLTGATA